MSVAQLMKENCFCRNMFLGWFVNLTLNTATLLLFVILSICTLAYAGGKVRKSKQVDIQKNTQGEEIFSETI